MIPTACARTTMAPLHAILAKITSSAMDVFARVSYTEKQKVVRAKAVIVFIYEIFWPTFQLLYS